MQMAKVVVEGSGRVSMERLPSEVAVIRLSAGGEHPVLLNFERLQSLRDCLAELHANPPRGLVLCSADEDSFCSGIDLTLLHELTDPAQAAALASQVQALFAEIAALPCSTVAAISGPCVGGGCELALACRHRVMSDARASVIGLPEITLGIIPGFGGTQRLPRLVGLRAALDMILSGRLLRPQQARVIGLVDDIVPFHTLLKCAEDIARGAVVPARKRLAVGDRLLMKLRPARAWIAQKAQRRIAAETRGAYPGPQAALRAVLTGLTAGQAAGLAYEAAETGKLLITPECKRLIRLFFLGESAKAIGRSARDKLQHVQVLVQGADTAGADLAATLAKHECSAILQDEREEALRAAARRVTASIARMRYCTDAERSFARNRIEVSSRDSLNLGNVTFAVDMLAENADVKQKRLIDLAGKLPHDVIIALNSPDLPVSGGAAGVPQRERVIGMHLFSPVEKVPAVELVRGRETNDRTIAIAAAVAVKMGKYPIVAADSPGALVYRLLTPYFNEALLLLAAGAAVRAVDGAALSFGMRCGPFALMDELGLGVVSRMIQIVRKAGGERFNGPDYLETLVEEGRLGKESGGGFYDYRKRRARPAKLRGLLALPAAKRDSGAPPDLQKRLILPLVNEAVRCLDEGIAGFPGPQAAGQIDLAAVSVAGFPGFRGGPLRYADDLGIQHLLRELDLLKQLGARFRPPEGLSSRAMNGKPLCGS